MPAYSAKALWEKLGLREGMTVVVRNLTGHPIPEYWKSAPLSLTVADASFPGIAFVHLFVDRRSDLAAEIGTILAGLAPDGMVWISWPKKAAKVPTDITEDRIRDAVLSLGLVDVKVCSVSDELWSGLKLVIRRENRSKAGAR